MHGGLPCKAAPPCFYCWISTVASWVPDRAWGPVLPRKTRPASAPSQSHDLPDLARQLVELDDLQLAQMDLSRSAVTKMLRTLLAQPQNATLSELADEHGYGLLGL